MFQAESAGAATKEKLNEGSACATNQLCHALCNALLGRVQWLVVMRHKGCAVHRQYHLQLKQHVIC